MMKTRLRERALALGFDACQVTSAAPPQSGGHLQRWLAAGRHGTMAYLARNAHKRADPQLVLPGARSIVCLAASYPCAGESPPAPTPVQDGTTNDPGPRGIVARYARSADYHELLAEPLTALAAFIDELGGPGTRSLWYTDTGPVLERDLAQRSGLGFIGKHTNLISRRLGNWFFLAEILTTAPLEPDPPEKNRCGTCTRCLQACPTSAFVQPFELDARRCIAYLTIEHKGSIPEPLRPLIGDRVFGCDDCLEACPWNRFAREGRLMKAHRRDDLGHPDLAAWLTLDEATFRRRFRGTPIDRIKRKGLLRNVCIALGNMGGRECLPALEKAAADPDPLIAEHARWALEQIQSRG